MAEWFVGPIMEKVIITCSEYLKDQFKWQKGLKDELQRLRENHPKIQSVVFFASSQAHVRDQNNSALNKWLWQLRDVIDEAEDVLDEFEYMKHKEQLTRKMEETKKRKATSLIFEGARKVFKIGERVLKIDPNIKRLMEVVQKLDNVSAGVDTFFYLVKDSRQEQKDQQLELYRARETGSLPKNDQIGRRREKEFVMQWLRRNPSNEFQNILYNNISLLSIVGHGGMGKTTLLQHVYKDEMTKEFDLQIWVCVSNNFGSKKVLADMLGHLKKGGSHLESLGTLQESLKLEVMSKKFLLVLDDIWEEDLERDKSKWENVLAPLAFGKLGSKILVTTRMESVSLMLANVINKKNETLRLEGLKEDECLQLLNRYAFANVDSPDVNKKLASIAEKIVKKLCGSPLAAKVMGGVLNSSLDERHWNSILNNDIGSHNDILPILELSYLFLPKALQNCYQLCCVFPQDHEFEADDLIRTWIALGFIQPSSIHGEFVEDIGKRYFDILVKKSLFDKFQVGDYSYYKLHDLLHELVRSISRQESFSIVCDENISFTIPDTIRQLFVKTNNLRVLIKMENFKYLRSLYLFYDDDDEDFVGVLTKIFKTSRRIRVLYIYAPCLKQIPEEIGHLIHLRYLRIVKTSVTKLPRSLSNLYHLQFMISGDKDSFWRKISDDFLPRDMNNLPSLQYLKSPSPGMHEIGKLNSLQELNGFYVNNEDGYRIRELEHMNALRLLKIIHLENIMDAEEAWSAKLYDKRNLMYLSLVWRNNKPWSYIADVDFDEKVLDNLQPPNSLKKLKIKSFMGARSAIWMNNVHLISNLEYIKLENCLEWQTLPSFGQLPFLKSLYLRNMPKVKKVDYKFHGNDKCRVFPSLQVLDIEDLRALEDWFDTSAAGDDCIFPCLTELYLQNCPKFHELPSCPPKLEKLWINGIGWKSFDWLQGIRNYCSITIKKCPNLISLRGHQEVETTENCQLILSELIIYDLSVLLMVPSRSITSIQKLEIKNIYMLVSFPNEAEQWFQQVGPSLCELEFRDLHLLKSLPYSLESLSSLKILRVSDVPHLLLLQNIPASLEQLELSCLKSLKYLPSTLESLSSLKILCVEMLPGLQMLPNFPTSLEHLVLKELKSLQSLPSLESLTSLKKLVVKEVPQLQLLPNMPISLELLQLIQLKALQSLPSSLESLSSLKELTVKEAPQLQLLPNMPTSLEQLEITKLHSLQSLPSSMENLSALKVLCAYDVPLLQLLPNIPISLERLELRSFNSLQCLQSLSSFSSLKYLELNGIPLQKLPELPPSLCKLLLKGLQYVDCLPFQLHSFYSLQELCISFVPHLRELPDLPPSLKTLTIIGCHPELVKLYEKTASQQKIAHISYVAIR